jgi:hypothetical protein
MAMEGATLSWTRHAYSGDTQNGPELYNKVKFSKIASRIARQPKASWVGCAG